MARSDRPRRLDTAAGPSRIHTGVPCLPDGTIRADRATRAVAGNLQFDNAMSSTTHDPWLESCNDRETFSAPSLTVVVARPVQPAHATPMEFLTQCAAVSRVAKNTWRHSSRFRHLADSPLVPRGNHCARRATRGRQSPANVSSHGMARQACRRQVRGSQASGPTRLKTKTEVDFRVLHKQRRCGSMKRMMFLGALVLGVTVCSQSFGFELLDRMLGHKGCASCCEPGCDAGAGCCEPGCGAGNGCAEPACGAGGCAEPACGAGNGCAEPACGAGNGCCEPSCGAASCCGVRKKHDLFGGLKGLFEKCKRKHHGCCDSCCEPACGAGNGCAEPACGAGNGCAEPACGAGNGCAEPACDAGAGCCEPSCGAASCCGTRKKCTPIADLLRAIHNAKKRCHRSSCCDSCCDEPDCSAGCAAEPACGAGNGCCEPACGAASYAPTATPAAPTPDASAAKKSTGKVVAVSRTVATK